MEQQHIVRIENYYGKTVQAVVLEEVNDGILKGWNYLQMPDGSKCYMARCWCLPLNVGGDTVDANDTDWRKFLREHWDNERNCCRTDCLERFYSIFRQACSNYMHRKTVAALQQEPQPVQQMTETAPKQHYVQLTLFKL